MISLAHELFMSEHYPVTLTKPWISFEILNGYSDASTYFCVEFPIRPHQLNFLFLITSLIDFCQIEKQKQIYS